MKYIIVLIAMISCLHLNGQEKYSKVKIFVDGEQMKLLSDLGVAVDRGMRKVGYHITTDLSQSDIAKVQSLGLKMDILIEDVERFYANQNKELGKQKNVTCSPNDESINIEHPENFVVSSSYGGYYTYNELLTELDKMATLYPNLISTKEPISTFQTWEQRPIYYVKISDNPSIDDGDPMVLYTALHHSREPMSLSQIIYYMWYLLENYDSNPEVRFLVDNTQMLFVPCVNPDGYVYNQTNSPNGGGMHRKNRNPNVGTSNKGVDINRNYGYGWGTTGVSTNVNDDTYPGTSAFSEPETQAMRWLVQNFPIKAAFNAHTYGDMLLFPIGTTSSEYADHHNYFVSLTDEMVRYNGYDNQKSSGLYPASGDSDDYMYKMDIGVTLKDTVFAMTPEIGGSFWPASNQILPTCQEMLHTNLSLAHMMHQYYVIENTDVSNVSALAGSFNFSVKKLGRAAGTTIVSLEPLLNLSTVGSNQMLNYNSGQIGTTTFSYTLNPSIQDGDLIKFVLTVNDGNWIRRDTIVKVFGDGSEIDVLVSDNADNAVNWSGGWSTTTSTFYSPARSFTESPAGNYPNNVSRAYVLNDAVDLTGMEMAKVNFYCKWAIEADYDMCQFQISTDNGSTWISQCGIYTTIATTDEGVQNVGQPKWDGERSNWVLEEINLSDYLNQTIKMRFFFQSDGGVRADGFYFDDFKISVKEQDEDGGEEGEEPSSNVAILNVSGDVLKIYPNPASTQFFIEGMKVEQPYEIVDARGIVVKTGVITMEKESISLNDLAKGTYFIRIQAQSSKLIKL